MTQEPVTRPTLAEEQQTLMHAVDWRARSDEWQERYWELFRVLEAIRPPCSCPVTDETIIEHDDGCPRLLTPVESLRAQLAQAPALAAENQKLREALQKIAGMGRIGPAPGPGGNIWYRCAWRMGKAARDALAPLLEGEGAST